MASKQLKELCSECDENASWYCIQDDANFCDQHNTVAHSLKSQKSHKIVSIGEKDGIIRHAAAKPKDCKNHHMPLCLYCLFCKDVCCVACLSVDIHKQHSDQVKSVVDVSNEEKNILSGHIEKIQKLSTGFNDEQSQLQQTLENIDIIEARSNEEIDQEFDQIIACVEARRKVLKKQLDEKSKTCRDNIYLRQEDLKNINSSVNRCLEEGQNVLTLNDFAALSKSKAIIEKIKKVETESLEYHQQSESTDSLSFYISSQTLLAMLHTLGVVGSPPTPSFAEQKCKADITKFDIEWEPVECNLPIAAYVLELGQDNNSFSEVYRGLETKYRLQGLKPSTSYPLRLYTCHGSDVGTAALLEIRTLKIDLNSWTLSVSSPYALSGAENSCESLLDGQFTTGTAASQISGSAWIQASFSYPVPVTTVTIAPLHKNPSTWTPTNGTGGTLQYSDDDSHWTTVGTIAYVQMQQQRLATGDVTAQYWRLSYSSYVGTSSFIFE